MTTSKNVKSLLKCSFCAKPQGKVKLLITGPDNEKTRVPYSICNECIVAMKMVMDADLSEAEVVND